MFKFWQENRAMRTTIGELEDALTSVRADLAKEKRVHDDTFKKLDDAVSDREKQRQQLNARKEECSDYAETVTRLRAQNEQQKTVLINLRSENAALTEKLLKGMATQEINDQLRADRDQWRERVTISEAKAANRYRELQNKFDKLTEALAAAKKETAELDERWIGEVMKKDEAIRNLIEERDTWRNAYDAMATSRPGFCARCGTPQEEKESTSDIEAYMEKQIRTPEMPLLTSIPKPPPAGRWRLVALSGHVVWISDAFKECPSLPHSTAWPVRCDFKWRSLVDNGEQRQCQLQNGHPGDHVYQSDATMPLKPGDLAGSGPRN